MLKLVFNILVIAMLATIFFVAPTIDKISILEEQVTSCRFSNVVWILLGSTITILLALVWFSYTRIKAKLTAALLLIVIMALLVLVLPRTVFERLEISAEQISYQREPPYTHLNQSVPLGRLQTVYKTLSPSPFWIKWLFGDSEIIGYHFVADDGNTIEIKPNVMLARTNAKIDAELKRQLIEVITLP